jgi:hypothetical protein
LGMASLGRMKATSPTNRLQLTNAKALTNGSTLLDDALGSVA